MNVKERNIKKKLQICLIENAIAQRAAFLGQISYSRTLIRLYEYKFRCVNLLNVCESNSGTNQSRVSLIQVLRTNAPRNRPASPLTIEAPVGVTG